MHARARSKGVEYVSKQPTALAHGTSRVDEQGTRARPRRKGVEYVSTIEHQRLPFFGTQWHPEKPPFEFSDDTIPHTHDAIAVSQHLRRARMRPGCLRLCGLAFCTLLACDENYHIQILLDM